ncbi:MAG: HD domain-containing protein [Alphaproteobacteria bacterium]|nr:HD domain-containing protein [Alphaproteobacteria bacterium]
MTGIEYIKQAVSELLHNDSSGHDDKHVFRVYENALKFCDELPEADRDLVAAAALLHDCDDYKLFGEESARLLTNTRRILAESGFDGEFTDKCLKIVKTIGYSKRLSGIIPDCIEGQIVSDADMADASGLIGVIRCIEYRAHRSKGGEPFFDPNYLPTEMNAEKYKQIKYCPIVNHFFDKLFRLRDMALTEPGRRCIEKRHEVIVNFLKTYFEEIEAPQVWKDLLAQYE